MKKCITLAFLGLIISTTSFAQLVPLTGATSACIGATVILVEMDSMSTGTWSSSNTAVATITASGTGSAWIAGIAAGTSTITYTGTPGGSYVTQTFTVGPSTPAAITGAVPLCIGGTCTLSDVTSGGSWSGGGVIATVSATGLVTAVSGGSAVISYSFGGCGVATTIAVGPTVLDSVSGPSGSGSASVCAGGTITLTDGTTGGAWSSSSTAIASVSATGVVTGVSAGSADIIYALTTGCGGAASAGIPVTVASITSAGTISGASSLLEGTAATLSDGVAGGAWSSSNTAVASVSSGSVTGLSAGTSVISYTVSGCGSSYTATMPVTVTALDGISGYVNVSTTGGEDIKVWLITYNPTTLDLEASDSTTISGSGSIYYEFTGMSTDSFRIKAAVATSLYSYDSTYTPTYHTSSFFWHDATVLYHTAGTGDINQNINMVQSATAYTGPGFIGGNVTSGANRGTSTGVPAVGILIYLMNTSGALVAQTYTDGSGNYSFSNLALGTYTIYPELINYNTTAYTSITLTASSDSMAAASFVQHTVSKTFTPVNEGVNNIGSPVSSIIAFPNPTSGKVTIQWQENTSEDGNITISDIMGREIYKIMINMNKGVGASLLDLSDLDSGIYLVSVKSGTISYNNKIQLQR